ncbi:monocarboxylate transporter 9 [Bradysia coprophila]|uniref:monocarboxylate transporter 9 n=1 Tax=Bradysia coprophila TaxID=38358 RepID=UPI00187D9DD4|nr:monocarboxylate transporter 9 [Bradysia coprophila]XP_037048824.1 monocarboxylate transporter 9 [Bradysia coprophila]XP_037048825.1 monocarboxylate transporter 9 [Bradysia coprophila]XP_037048826.1 monocarboxylate transporter 9 [Bradysia coprophila]
MPPSNTIATTDPKQQHEQNGNGVKEVMNLEPPTTTIVVPPDGGWGWVVVVASFVSNVIVDGIVMSAGMFKEPMTKDFGASASAISLVFSLLSGFYLIAGPFAASLANRYGFRPITIIGSFIASFAFGISYLADGVVYMYIIYGVIGGVGFSMIYIPSVIIVGYYFERWRALATGVALCGSGVGTFLFAPFNEAMIKAVGWRTTLLIQSAIILTCTITGSMYRPLKPIQVTVDEEQEEKKIMLPIVFTKPLPEGRYAFSVPNSVHNTWIGASNNTTYPTAAEVFRGMGANMERTERRTSSSATPPTNVLTSVTSKKLEQLHRAQRRSSGHSTPEHDHQQPPLFNLTKELNTLGEADEENENDTLIDEEIKPVSLMERRHTVSGRRPILPKNRKGALTDNRPMYRDDVFFHGSLARIPQYQSQSSLGYHMAVTRMPTQHDVEEEEQNRCAVCSEAVRRTLATMLDLSLLKSPSFMLLALSGFLTMMGFFVPFMFMKDRGVQEMDESTAAFTVAAIGIANTIARIVCGILSSFKGVNALWLNNVAITLGGIATMLSGLYLTEAYQFTYAAIFGVAIACFSALRSLIAVDLMGLEKLTNAFGILMLFQGLAAVMGGPIAGMLYDATKSFDYSFYFAGALITLSAILCYPLNYVNKWEKARAEKDSKKPAV